MSHGEIMAFLSLRQCQTAGDDMIRREKVLLAPPTWLDWDSLSSVALGDCRYAMAYRHESYG